MDDEISLQRHRNAKKLRWFRMILIFYSKPKLINQKKDWISRTIILQSNHLLQKIQILSLATPNYLTFDKLYFRMLYRFWRRKRYP